MRDVPGLGVAGYIARVAPGRARNQLVPSGEAKYATFEHRHLYQNLIEAAKSRTVVSTRSEADLESERVERAVRLLTSASVCIRAVPAPPRAAGDPPAPFPRDAITPERLRTQILNQLGIDVAAELLNLQKPLTAFGEYKVPLRLTVPSEDGLEVRPSVRVDFRRKRVRSLKGTAAKPASSGAA